MIIEADVLLLNWGELAMTQLMKFGEMFTVILMDLPWKIRMGLRYPLLTFTQIFEIPFHILQDRGFVMIWVLADNEDRVIEKMKQKGYRKWGRVTWIKTTKKQIPVNFIGKLLRHSTEAMIIFSKGDVSEICKKWSMNDTLCAPFTG